jgi:hypothetical protein
VDDHHLDYITKFIPLPPPKKNPPWSGAVFFSGDKLLPLGDKLKGPATHTKDISGKNGPKSPHLDYKF